MRSNPHGKIRFLYYILCCEIPMMQLKAVFRKRLTSITSIDTSILTQLTQSLLAFCPADQKVRRLWEQDWYYVSPFPSHPLA